MLNTNQIMENQFKLIAKNPNITRSPKITLELHSSIKELCKKHLGEGYDVVCQDTSEYVFSGKFLDKKVDVAILKNNSLVGAIEVKAIRSSYKKNATNYFYNMLGETANLKEAGVKVCQLIIIPEIVRFKESGRIKEETIYDTQIEKYLKLEKSNSQMKPDSVIVNMVAVNYETNSATTPKLDNITNEEIKSFLIENLNVEKKITDFLENLK